jgi:hypothetical protein
MIRGKLSSAFARKLIEHAGKILGHPSSTKPYTPMHKRSREKLLKMAEGGVQSCQKEKSPSGAGLRLLRLSVRLVETSLCRRKQNVAVMTRH